MRFTTSTTALLISLALTVSAAPTKLSTSLKNPPEQEVPSIVGGALDLAGGITSDAGADKVGDALTGAGEAVDVSDAEKKKPHRVRNLKGDYDKGDKKEAAGAATGGALELAGAITSAAGACKVGDALSAAGGAVDGKKGGDGKAGDGKGCDGVVH